MSPQNAATMGGEQSGLASILRWGILRLGRYGSVTETLDKVFERFATVGGNLLDAAATIIRDGALAVTEFLRVGQMTRDVMSMTPVIPMGTFGTNLADRIIVAGDIVGVNPQGIEVARRIYSVGIDEGDALEDLFGASVRRIYERIKRSDPEEAADFVDRSFLAYWQGKHW